MDSIGSSWFIRKPCTLIILFVKTTKTLFGCLAFTWDFNFQHNLISIMGKGNNMNKRSRHMILKIFQFMIGKQMPSVWELPIQICFSFHHIWASIHFRSHPSLFVILFVDAFMGKAFTSTLEDSIVSTDATSIWPPQISVDKINHKELLYSFILGPNVLCAITLSNGIALSLWKKLIVFAWIDHRCFN